MASAQVDARGGLIVAASLASAANQKSAVLEQVGTIAVDPADQVGAGFFDTDITITGLAVGDLIFVQPPDAFEDELRLVGAAAQAADTLRIKMESTGAINGISREWIYQIFRTTA